jgi:hypothetical protein
MWPVGPWGSPRRPLMARWSGSGCGTAYALLAASCGTRRGGGGTYVRWEANGYYRRLAPLLRRRAWVTRHGRRWARHGAGTTPRVTRGADLGTRGLGKARVDLEAEGGGRPEVRCAWARPALWPTRHRGAASFPARVFWLRLHWPSFSPKIWTEVHLGVNSKVVDLCTLYNFYKGSIVFFSMDCA